MGYSLCGVLTPTEPDFPRIEWEESPCPLCGGTDSAHKLEAPEPVGPRAGRCFLIVGCRHCGLCYTNPRPSAPCLARLFPPPLVTTPGQRPARRWDLLDPLLERGSLLDIGNGVGPFLHRLHQRGRPFLAVNLAPAATDFLRRQWYVTALPGPLPHPDLTGPAFDVITCVNVLEQVHKPLELLRAARQLLAPGGVLVVAVPNFDSLPLHWFGASWPGLNLPRHLTHFTPRTLRLMLQQADFRLHRLTPLRHSGWLRHSPPSHGWGRLLRTKPTASVASWYTALLRRANGMLALATR